MLKAEEYKLLADDISTKYNVRNAEYEEMRRMCDLDWRKVNEVEGASKVVDVTPYVALEHAVGVLTKNVPTLIVELATEDYLDTDQMEAIQSGLDLFPAENTLKQQVDLEAIYGKARNRADEAAEKLENILKGVWRVTQDDQQVDLLQKTIREYYGRFGSYCFKILYNGSRPKESSTSLQPDKGGACRYVIQTRDPRTIYPKDGPFGPLYVVEKYKRSVKEIQKSWPKAKLTSAHTLTNTSVLDPNAEVDWTEYWDDEVKVFWAGDQVVMPPTLHQYGSCPYVTHFGRSFLYPLWAAGVWTANNQLLSMSITHALHYVNSAYVVRTMDGAEAKIDTTPGSMNTLMVGEDINPLVRAMLPGDMLPLMERMETQNQRVAFTAQAYGEPSAQSGYGTALLLHGTEVKLVSQLTSLEMGLERVFMKLARLMKPFPPKGLRIYGATDRQGNKVRMFEANSDDIPDNPVIEVVLKPALPHDRMQLATLASMMVDKGLMSRELVQGKYLEIESVIEENQRIRQDLVSMSPEVQKVYSTSAALIAQAEEEPKILKAKLQNAREVLQLKKELAQIQAEIAGIPEEPPAPPGLIQPDSNLGQPNPGELRGGGQPPAPRMPMPSPDVQPYPMATGNAPVPPDGGQMEMARAGMGMLPPRPQAGE